MTHDALFQLGMDFADQSTTQTEDPNAPLWMARPSRRPLCRMLVFKKGRNGP